MDSTQLTAARQSDGKLPVITFGHLVGGSDLIEAGTGVGMSATPDMGVDWAYLNTTYYAGEPEPPAGDTEPIIYTNSTTYTSVTASTGGNVTSDGGDTVTERGIVWGTSANPTTSNNKISTTGTTGSYTISIDGLKSNTTYHVRSYAINGVGTAYGADVSFTTSVYSVGKTEGKVVVQDGKIVLIK